MAERDWLAWHAPYEDPDSHLSRRLRTVQDLLRDALDAAPAGTIRLVSMCAGQGHDVLGVLTDHPRRSEVRALLVERDPRNIDLATDRAATAAGDIVIREADAGTTTAYQDEVPADVVLVCGVFGNITDPDVHHTIATLPSLCTPSTTVIWTRHRRPPDLTPSIRRWFSEAGFVELAFVAPDDMYYGVGAHRFAGTPDPFRAQTLFEFVGHDTLLADGGA